MFQLTAPAEPTFNHPNPGAGHVTKEADLEVVLPVQTVRVIYDLDGL